MDYAVHGRANAATLAEECCGEVSVVSNDRDVQRPTFERSSLRTMLALANPTVSSSVRSGNQQPDGLGPRWRHQQTASRDGDR